MARADPAPGAPRKRAGIVVTDDDRKRSRCESAMDGLEYCEDLSTLPELADSALLTCLEQRYRKGKVQVSA